MANAIRRFLTTDDKNHTGRTCIAFESVIKGEILIMFEPDNRNSAHRKMTVWHDLCMLAIHRYACTDSEYFEKKKWDEIVPSRRKLSTFDRVLQNLTGVSIVSRSFLYRERVDNWLSIDWSDCWLLKPPPQTFWFGY